MEKIESLAEESCNKICLAIGCFDGLHRGHLKILDAMIAVAKAHKIIPSVLTFKDDIKGKIRGCHTPRLISSASKEKLLSEMGIKRLYSIGSNEIIHMSPKDFIEEIIHKKLKVAHIFCGFNFQFGKNKSGDIELLKALCPQLGIKVHTVEPIYENNILISSSKIRECIKLGQIELANSMLGRNFSYDSPFLCDDKCSKSGSIIKLKQIFPDSLVIPASGFYKSVVKVGSDFYNGITKIGAHCLGQERYENYSETFIFNANLKKWCDLTVNIALLEPMKIKID